MLNSASSSFDVLAPDLDLTSSYLLEASAGTGKTFAIEHLVTRYLLEEPKIALDQIAVVTFTRKAARQMRQRVRLNLESALRTLQAFRSREGAEVPSDSPPYLRACMELGPSPVAQAIAYLQDALENFDLARISTIHSFCSKLVLQESLGASSSPDTSQTLQAVERLERQIKHWLFEDWGSRQLGQIELAEALKALSNEPVSWDEKRLVRELTDVALGMGKLFTAPGLDQLVKEMRVRATALSKGVWQRALCEPFPFKNAIREPARRRIALALELLVGDWPHSRFIPADDMIQALTSLLKVWRTANIRNEFVEDAATRQLAQFFDELAESYDDSLKNIAMAKAAFLHLASACQAALAPILETTQLLSADQILERAVKSAQDPSTAAAQRQMTKVFIVDEFQDTDPEQWAIFESLYLSPGHSSRVIFVGDPKQSIYAFRQADIYTYDKARCRVDKTRTLDVNFRAKQSLVDGLNELMSPEHVGNWIELPKSNSYLAVQRVLSHHQEPRQKRVHFLPKAQTFEHLCHHTARQIKTIESSGGDGQIAVLVDTNKRGDTLRSILSSHGISCRALQEKKLAQLPALGWLQTLLYMVLEPKDKTLRRALAEPLLGWTDRQILETFSPSSSTLERPWKFLGKLYSQRAHLRRALLEKGFTHFYIALMNSCWLEKDLSVAEHLIKSQPNLLRRQWEQVVHLLMEVERAQLLRPNQLPRALENLQTLEKFTGKSLAPAGGEDKAVQVLTLHGSKGLEFEHVFALGVVCGGNRKAWPFKLVRVEDTSGGHLTTELDALSPSSRALYNREQEAEKARLLYVALTRAKDHLYIPLPLANSEKKDDKRITAPPLIWFLARFNAFVKSYGELQERVRSGSFEEFYSWLGDQTKDPNSSIDWLQERKLDVATAQRGAVAPISQGAVAPTPQGAITLDGATSSTHLNKKSSGDGQGKDTKPILRAFHYYGATFERTSFSAWAAKQSSHSDPDDSFQEDQDTQSQSALTLPESEPIESKDLSKDLALTPDQYWHILPRGPHVGDSLHQLLQQVSMTRALLDSQNSADFAQITEHLDLDLSAFPMAQLLAGVFASSLALPGQMVSLNNIPAGRCRAEMEFLLSQDDNPGEVEPYRGIYWNGFIDLFFEHENRFYLLDWKSNYLGSGDEAYTPERIAWEIERCSYLAQAQLYSAALVRHLSLSGRSGDFGGFIFFFLRGRKAHFLSKDVLLPPFFAQDDANFANNSPILASNSPIFASKSPTFARGKTTAQNRGNLP